MKPRIWVLGAGQLGAMLKHAGMPLGLVVCPVDIDETAAPSLEACDWVTAERELWPQTLATRSDEQAEAWEAALRDALAAQGLAPGRIERVREGPPRLQLALASP